MTPNVIVLAGGASSRMKNKSVSDGMIHQDLLRQAQERAKSMIGVGPSSRPFLDYLLNNAAQAGYRNVVIVVGERDISVRDYYEKGRGADQWGQLDISYAVQRIPDGRTTPSGAADALLQGLKATPSWQGQKFTVCNSDNLYSVQALRLLLNDTHANAMIDYDRSALEFDRDRIKQFAVITKNQDGSLVDIVEKPSSEVIARAADSSGRIGVSMNIFRFDYDMILPILETQPFDPLRSEKDIPAAIRGLLLQHSNGVFAIPLAEHVIDLTDPSDIPVVSEYLHHNFPNR